MEEGKKRYITVNDIVNDPISKLACEYWASGAKGDNVGKFEEDVVKTIYRDNIENFNIARVQILETSGYFDNYLWPNFTATSSLEHFLSIIVLINQKSIEGSNLFDNITKEESKFQLFFTKLVEVASEFAYDDVKKMWYIRLLVNMYHSLENPIVRKSCLRYLFLPLWDHLSNQRLQSELALLPQVRKTWNNMVASKKNNTKSDGDENPNKRVKLSSTFGAEGNWIPSLVYEFLENVENFDFETNNKQTLTTIEIFSELLVDLLSQLPTRRFLNTFLQDKNLIIRCQQSSLYKSPNGKLFARMVDMIENFATFPFQDHTGKALTLNELSGTYQSRILRLQQVAFDHYQEEMKDLIFSSVGVISHREALQKHLIALSIDKLIDIAIKIGRLAPEDIETYKAKVEQSTSMEVDETSDMLYDFVLETLLNYLIPRKTQIEEIKTLSLYPTEETLWDSDMIPMTTTFSTKNEQVLALPKLNLQFLTMYDYLLRNFSLFRLESAYEIREDVVDVIKRMGPRTGLRGETVFGGWARMAMPISSVAIDDVAKPRIGENVPRHVKFSINLDFSRFTGAIREEWESFREHDVVFLVCIQRPSSDASQEMSKFEEEQKMLSKGLKPKKSKDSRGYEETLDFPQRYGIRYIRGGEVFEFQDESGVALNEPTRPDERPSGRVGTKRRLRVFLDPAQFYNDQKVGNECYESFNLLIRRDPKENNFKAILETIRDLMNVDSLGQAVPAWLHDVFLGYGNPSSANYRSMSKVNGTVEEHDYVDTFLSAQHVVDSFPNAESITFECGNSNQNTITPGTLIPSEVASVLPNPPYKLRIERPAESTSIKDKVFVSAYAAVNRGPYPIDRVPTNNVRFTSRQVESIRSGMNTGLTLLVGPPGTGKTDTAVQLISNLYHNFPGQKILIVTHSNAALNDIFEKIMERDVDPRHLLRLGSGERDLRETLAVAGAKGSGRGQGEEFSKQGRVNWSLTRRAQLLQQVQRLGQSLGVQGDVGYTCETAGYFYIDKIRSCFEKFEMSLQQISATEPKGQISSIFPFHVYFIDAPQPLFKGSFESDIEIARGCFRHIRKIFTELEDYRAFELLRTQAHRTDYLLTKQARIVAMTCTHAAIIRRKLVDLNFKYDSLIMEESAQVLEVETFIPMLLQSNSSVEGCNLKRVVLIGDHHQLPPVVQHPAFQKYSKLDQSMFTRFIRLGVPHITLDKQGRARPEIAALYSWRYSSQGSPLLNLEGVSQHRQYITGNAGFNHPFQFIDVPDFQGHGEVAPTPFFYQNLGEAEYAVALYQYMRLLGYPAEKISIITTYNGQRSLIRDILAQRCKNPIFGMPATVTTVDKYQGQQNDYIILSLVRTESIGHIRDVRRLIVALSRARLGLYVLGRFNLYQNCYELSPAFSILSSKPTNLELVQGESWPTTRLQCDQVARDRVVSVNDVTQIGVLVYKMTQSVLSTGASEANAPENVQMEESSSDEQ